MKLEFSQQIISHDIFTDCLLKDVGSIASNFMAASGCGCGLNLSCNPDG